MTPLSLFGHNDDDLPKDIRAKGTTLLAIDADLSAPPSTPAVFRDVTLVASIRGYEVVALAPPAMLDCYNNWFWRNGLWSYVSDLIASNDLGPKEAAIEILGGPDAKLTAHNLAEVLRHIPVRG